MTEYHLVQNLNEVLWLTPLYTIKEKCLTTKDIFRATFGLPKELINLDSQEIKKHLAITLLISVYTNSGFGRIMCLHLTNSYLRNEYDTILQIYKHIPDLLLMLGYKIPKHYLHDLRGRYFALSQWIYHIYYRLPIKNLNSSFLMSYKKAAYSSFKRYELVFGMDNLKIFESQNYNHPEVPLTNVHLTWLLWEISMVITDINKGNEQNSGISKKRFYEETKKYINNLSELEDNPELEIIPTSNLIFELDKYLNGLSKCVARKNPEFDEDYFTPYIKALTRENSYGKKNQKVKSPKPVKKKKPGRKGHWEQ